MPWQCPRCNHADGRPVRVTASAGKVLVESECVGCGHRYTVERESVDLRLMWPASPSSGETDAP